MKPTEKQIREIFEWWNRREIVVHRAVVRHEKHINAALKLYSMDEITEAMSNYAVILKSDEYYWTYRWSLKDFLIRGLDRFMTVNRPFDNFRCTTANSTITDTEDIIDPPDEDKDFKERFLEAKKEQEVQTAFNVWCDELQELLRCEKDQLDRNAWEQYFHEGYSPKEAFQEDMSYG